MVGSNTGKFGSSRLLLLSSIYRGYSHTIYNMVGSNTGKFDSTTLGGSQVRVSSVALWCNCYCPYTEVIHNTSGFNMGQFGSSRVSSGSKFTLEPQQKHVGVSLLIPRQLICMRPVMLSANSKVKSSMSSRALPVI